MSPVIALMKLKGQFKYYATREERGLQMLKKGEVVRYSRNLYIPISIIYDFTYRVWTAMHLDCFGL